MSELIGDNREDKSMNQAPSTENFGEDSKKGLGLKVGILILAAGTLLAAGAKRLGKVDLTGTRQRVKWLPFKPQGEDDVEQDQSEPLDLRKRLL